MKQLKQSQSKPQPLKLLGRRVLITVDLIPYMHMLSPLALALVTLRNPPGMIYTKKVFLHMKKALLERSFRKKFLKNEQKAKLLLKGYERLHMGGRRSKSKQSIFRHNFTKSFNISMVKQCFEQISKLALLRDQEKDQDKSFIDSIDITLKSRHKFDLKNCQRIKKLLNIMIQKEKKKEYEKCEYLFEHQLLRIRIPWTQNIYDDIQVFGKELWGKYLKNQLDQLSKQKSWASESYSSHEKKEKQEEKKKLKYLNQSKQLKTQKKKQKKSKKEQRQFIKEEDQSDEEIFVSSNLSSE